MRMTRIDALVNAAAKLARSSREGQGLPSKLVDPATVRTIALIIGRLEQPLRPAMKAAINDFDHTSPCTSVSHI